MTNNQIETSREIRLWMSRVVIPIFGVAMMVPEAREKVMTRLKNAKRNIENTFKSK